MSKKIISIIKNNKKEGEHLKFQFIVKVGYFCNFRCSYCIQKGRFKNYINLNKEKENAKLLMRSINNNLKDVILQKQSNYKENELHFSGGEPTLFPLVELYDELGIKFQTIKLVSNLSASKEYFEKLYSDFKDRDTNLRIAASFHDEYFTKEEFLEKCKALDELGIDVKITVVAVKDRFNVNMEAAEYFAENDFVTSILPEQILLQDGSKNGLAKYSDEEKKRINDFNKKYKKLFYKITFDDNTTDEVSQINHMKLYDENWSPKKYICSMIGQRINLKGDGQIIAGNPSCNSETNFCGNVFEKESINKDLLLKNKMPCSQDYCSCGMPDRLILIEE